MQKFLGVGVGHRRYHDAVRPMFPIRRQGELVLRRQLPRINHPEDVEKTDPEGRLSLWFVNTRLRNQLASP